MPAHATANRVMASANRLIDVRHFWFKRNKMAEINVPAWPMPIHQTKFTMANPQPMGMLMPQMPVPLMMSQPMAMVIIPSTLKAMPNPMNQPSEVGRVRTIELILSVTDP